MLWLHLRCDGQQAECDAQRQPKHLEGKTMAWCGVRCGRVVVNIVGLCDEML